MKLSLPHFMQRNLSKKKSGGKGRMTGRFAGGIVLVLAMFAYLFSGLIQLQLKDSESYVEKASNTRTKTIVLRGKRGNITDGDSVILAQDELIYNVTFYKDPSQTSKKDYRTFSQSMIETI